MWCRQQAKCVLDLSIIQALEHWNKTSTGLVTGESGIFPLALIWQVLLVQLGYKPHTIDCAMRGNAFTIADEAMRRNLQPEAVLESISIQRAFTPYQILDVMHEILENPKDRIYTILAPCKQFFDGDVGDDEGTYLLGKLIQIMKKFSNKNIPLFIVETQKYNHQAFPEAFKQIRQLARPVFELSLQEKEFSVQYNIQISKSGRFMGQKSIFGGKDYGQNAACLFDTNRPGKRTFQGIQKRTA